MTSVKNWAAIATLIAVILGAFATGAALARVARLHKALPDTVRLDRAAESNRVRGTDRTSLRTDRAGEAAAPAPAAEASPGRASAFSNDNSAVMDGSMVADEAQDLGTSGGGLRSGAGDPGAGQSRFAGPGDGSGAGEGAFLGEQGFGGEGFTGEGFPFRGGDDDEDRFLGGEREKKKKKEKDDHEGGYDGRSFGGEHEEGEDD